MVEAPFLMIAVLGPTASGKSSLALEIAPRLGGEIVNCDSMQMVRFLQIGTAKPGPLEQGQVPHHLFDVVDPDEYFSAGSYMERARAVCWDIAARGMVPIVVGGTGLYFRALVKGIFAGPGRSADLRQRLQRIAERRGAQVLHRILARRDPEAARSIQSNDLIRVVRALEVMAQTGRRMSEVQSQTSPLTGFSIVKIGLNVSRQKLYDRINYRVEQMFQLGLVDEVRALLTRGYSPSAKGFEALGYRHALKAIQGELTVDEAIQLTQRDTRRYAKRQLTWFRKEEDVTWLNCPGEDPAALGQVLQVVKDVQERHGIRTRHRT
jgi:tRNA dimethylallyltransferase